LGETMQKFREGQAEKMNGYKWNALSVASVTAPPLTPLHTDRKK